MIQALRIVDIANARSTKKNTVSRSRVQYHCRKMNYQHVVLPIKKLYPDQANQVIMYLDGHKIMRDGVQVNPVRLIPVTDDKVKPGNYDVWAMYWNKARYYKLPKGCELLGAADPIIIMPAFKKLSKNKHNG